MERGICSPHPPSHIDHCCTERPPGDRLSEGVMKEATEAMLGKRGLMGVRHQVSAIMRLLNEAH